MPPGTFTFQGSSQRVVFGSGTVAELGAEADRLGLDRVLVLSTHEQRRQADLATSHLGSRAVSIFSDARMHTPVETTTAAMAVVTRENVDGLVAVGGGSTTGLAKALAVRTDLPQIIVPTTYAGSEATDILGETAGGEKKTRRDPKIRPEVILYDVDLTIGLPKRTSVTSGMNAIAHAVEGLYARDGSPLVSLMAEEGIRTLASALAIIPDRPADQAARADALYGAWLCGTVLGATSMALHHKLCHVLGGSFDLPHAETHAVLLPHVVAFNRSAAPDAVARAARALGAEDAPAALFDLVANGGAPTSLREIGLAEADLNRAAELAVANAYWNPAPMTREAIRALLVNAWDGRRP